MGQLMQDGEDHEYEDDADELLYNQRGPSKSSRKRESTALQDLGQELLELPAERLAALNLPEDLFEAVRVGQTISAHGGLKRQRKYIGKLLRNLDAQPIKDALAAIRGEGVDQARMLHQCERWRDTMLAEGDGSVNAFVGEFPDADRQKLRRLVRDARQEREQGRPPRSARLLFRYVKECLIVNQEDDDTGTAQDEVELD